MPLNDLFTYKITELLPEKVEAHLVINFAHEIFQGHFPGNPVLPGVTQIEFIRRLLSDLYKCEAQLKTARDIKYMNPMTPENAAEVDFIAEIDHSDGEIRIRGSFKKGDLIFTKIRGVFSEG
jgi:3-hydroxyacyl-[acyl-carrier-protein] dehydratase